MMRKLPDTDVLWQDVRETPRERIGADDPFRGRGASMNPANRFEKLHVEEDRSELPEDEHNPHPVRTLYLRDDTKTIIARNNSPDVGFETSINPYRGCEHGCIYCFARP